MALENVVLRDYQWDSTSYLAKSARDGHRKLGLASPTGSGKTNVILTLAAKTRSLFSAVLIATPTEQIEESFYKDVMLEFEPHYELGHTSVIRFPITKNMFTRPRSEDVDGRAELKQLLSEDGHNRPFFLTTHHQLTVWSVEILPDDLTGKLLVLDEAHRAGTDAGEKNLNKVIGEFARVWIERNGSVLYVSAHPFRADDLSVFPEGTVYYTRNIAEHSFGGVYAPSHFHSETVTVDLEMDTTAKYAGDAFPEDSELRIAAEAMVNHWMRIGKPKTVFNVPSGLGDRATLFADMLMRVFEEQGETRIVNAVGNKDSVKENFLSILARERSIKTFSESKVDVFIACKRFDEGTDWPVCSHVFNWGISSSLSLSLQRWGRAMRLKKVYPDYPSHFINEAVMVYFVGRVSKDVLAEHEAHKEHALLLACTMADWETGIKLRSGFHFRMKGIWPKRPLSETEELEQTAFLQAMEVSEAARARAIAKLTKLEAEFGRPPTNGEVLSRLSDLSEEEVLAVELIISERLPEMAQGELIKSLSSPPKNFVRADLLAILREALDRFKDLSVSMFGEVVSFYTRFTGLQASEVATFLRDRCQFLNFTRENLESAVSAHISETGKGPSVGYPNQDATRFFGFKCTWHQADRGCRKNLGISLSALKRDMGLRHLTLEKISKALRRYIRKNGGIPTKQTKAVEFSCSWGKIIKWLEDHHHKKLEDLLLKTPRSVGPNYEEELQRLENGQADSVGPNYEEELQRLEEGLQRHAELQRLEELARLIGWDMSSHWRTRESLVRSYGNDEVMLRKILEVDGSVGVTKSARELLRSIYCANGTINDQLDYLNTLLFPDEILREISTATWRHKTGMISQVEYENLMVRLAPLWGSIKSTGYGDNCRMDRRR